MALVPDEPQRPRLRFGRHAGCRSGARSGPSWFPRPRVPREEEDDCGARRALPARTWPASCRLHGGGGFDVARSLRQAQALGEAARRVVLQRDPARHGAQHRVRGAGSPADRRREQISDRVDRLFTAASGRPHEPSRLPQRPCLQDLSQHPVHPPPQPPPVHTGARRDPRARWPRSHAGRSLLRRPVAADRARLAGRLRL
mmetsp:Transcript_17370/g.34045  ORF Transcript_17370/g.34045 Transcript_17370/m.34045 type:complete len:200 (+) Transcript_17370:416-1015(+)